MARATLSLLILIGLIETASSAIVWRQYMNQYPVAEDAKRNDIVYTLKADDVVNGVINTQSNIIYGVKGIGSTPFLVNSTSGDVIVYLPRLLDRELNKEVTVTFYAYIAGTTNEESEVTATIVIKDVNDNPPQFQQTTYSTTLDETVPIGTTVISSMSVSDLDVTINNPSNQIEVTCNKTIAAQKFLQNVCDIFSVTRIRSSNTDWLGRIVLSQPLDYEAVRAGSRNSYQIPLTATDGTHWTDQSVEVFVNDVQDTPPIFIKAGPTFVVNESYPALQRIDNVIARDQDLGSPREIYYEIISNPGNVFDIDLRSGYIWPKVELDLDNPIIQPTMDIVLKAREILNITTLTLGDDAYTTATSTVQVIIRDINDNKPTFEFNFYTTEIFEDIADNTALPNVRILVDDKDSIPNNKYAVLLDFTDVFKLADTATSGSGKSTITILVKNTTLIDYEKGPRNYTLRIVAQETDTSERYSSSALVYVKVLDVNDNSPQFSQPAYVESISENTPVGTPVITVTAIDIDSGMFGTIGIRYELVGPGNDRFQIDPITGIVRVKSCFEPSTIIGCLDYETVPSYLFTVIARDNDGTGIPVPVDLKINIIDENDNPPIFGPQSYSSYIKEGDLVPSPTVVVKATDRDKVGGPLSFTFIAEDVPGLWRIDRLGNITASRPIKYQDTLQMKGFFLMTVQVTDGKYTDTASVRINVLDINDNKPIFERSSYYEKIPETTRGTISILTVKANDADDPSTGSGQIKYSIQDGDQGKFVIDEITGRFSTSLDATFNFDTQKQYIITVIASDQGFPQQYGTCTVTIDIIDNNNQDPYFFPTTQTTEVVENSPVRFPMYTVKAVDPDVGAVLRYEFNEPKEAITPDGTKINVATYDFRNLFSIDNDTGTVRVNQPLDRNKAATVIYSMTVFDVSANPVQKGTGTLIIYILEFNSIPPVFDNYPPTITIREEQPVGTFIIALIARDLNGIAGYEMVDQPDGYFTLNYESGVVSVNKRIDYDDVRNTSSTYFVAEAKDLGRPQLSARVRINVIIENVNDNIPEFIKSSYIVSIPENSPETTFIVDVSATDRDREDGKGYGTVRYSMDDKNFRIDNITGRVTVGAGAILDRETTPNIVIQAIAYDTPQGPQSVRRQNAATIYIRLTDVNDNPPVFSSAEYFATIFETILPDTEVLQVFANDKDEGINSLVDFTKVLGSGDPDDYFQVGARSGRISVKKSLLRKVGTYKFQVQAHDGIFTAIANITIRVLDAANAPPEWVIPPRENMTIDVLEEQYLGMIVYIVSAVDEDSGKNGIVDYSFFQDGKYTTKTKEFEINSITGVIQAERVYDREKQDRYVLMLIAKDRAQTPQQTNRFLTIRIKDVNDNDPSFPLDSNGNPIPYEFSVNENAPAGTPIGHVLATDRDLNPVIYYFIIAGNDDNIFQLNPTNGSLFLNKALDRESKSIYYLDVQASNNIPDYTVIRERTRRATDASIVRVKISVGDINDVAPVFTQVNYTGCISTRSPFSKSIVQVQAVDRDSVGTGIVLYRIVNGNMDIFAVNERLGIVTNKVLVKDYADQRFVLTVEARDAINITDSVQNTVPVYIFVTQPSKEVKLLITQSSSEVRLYQNQIIKALEKTVDIVCITNIQDHLIDSTGATTTLWSDVYISGIRISAGQFRILPASELVGILNEQRRINSNDFDQLYIKDFQTSGQSNEIIDTKPALIVMIIIIILIFICIVFAILAFYCIKRSGQDKKRLLYHRTHKTQNEEPVPVYDNRGFAIEQVHQEDPIPMYAKVEKQRLDERPQQPEPEPVWEAPKDEEDEPRIETEVQLDTPPSSPRSSTRPTPHDEGNEYRIETELI
ncbi:hypothetical protein CHS0354_025527 [Potamilus streckersoni]|uniref:Cadherin domain-containing protein n=1 Tax=Potamilus streckersoni TaxID=2493646 RepID=A0AAE0SKY2_9BIVA|nr:hypothetical protein CHS0354_025527 [Potamilus streckersoni]